MNRSNLRPIEDAIRESMLHIAKTRRFARALKLRIVDDELGPRFARGHSKDGRSFQQTIRDLLAQLPHRVPGEHRTLPPAYARKHPPEYLFPAKEM